MLLAEPSADMPAIADDPMFALVAAKLSRAEPARLRRPEDAIARPAREHSFLGPPGRRAYNSRRSSLWLSAHPFPEAECLIWGVIKVGMVVRHGWLQEQDSNLRRTH
jgi:hypothetical protein